jgi:hypothetical protein
MRIPSNVADPRGENLDRYLHRPIVLKSFPVQVEPLRGTVIAP